LLLSLYFCLFTTVKNSVSTHVIGKKGGIFC